MIRLGFLWIALLAAVVLIAAAAFKLHVLDAGASSQGFAQQATPVAVEPARRVEFADVVEALGTANANESVSITSKVTETVSRIAYDSGDLVQAGDVLAELADAEEAANLTEGRSTLEEALRERSRYNELESRGVASQQTLDQLDSNVERARARVRTIEARLADRIVRAPFAGVVGLRQASPGMLARPGDVIATLDDVSVIKLDFTIPEHFLAAVVQGSRLEAEAAAYPGETFVGQVSQIDSRVDPVTRTATVRALVDNADRRLYPGMLMVVEVVRDVRQSIAAPELALVRRGDAAFVYVVQETPRGSVASQRAVTTGARRDGMVEILSGLEEGELVVSKGVHRLRDGAPVVVAGAAPSDQVAAAGRGA
jgi:membrane fusion protein (multidrug efflux system)